MSTKETRNYVNSFLKQLNEWETFIFTRMQSESSNKQVSLGNTLQKIIDIKNRVSNQLDVESKNEIELTLQQYTCLNDLYTGIRDCQRCSLGHLRNQIVFGTGSESAKIIFIGEAPGEDEDLTGIPFVGRGGKLLTNIMTEAGIPREEVYICNVLKCRPPKNRDPLPEEVSKCKIYLERQIEILNPILLVAIGRISAQLLLDTNVSISKLKREVHSYRDLPLMITYHPAYVLRNYNAYPEVVQDMIRIREMFFSLGGSFSEK